MAEFGSELLALLAISTRQNCIGMLGFKSQYPQ